MAAMNLGRFLPIVFLPATLFACVYDDEPPKRRRPGARLAARTQFRLRGTGFDRCVARVEFALTRARALAR